MRGFRRSSLHAGVGRGLAIGGVAAALLVMPAMFAQAVNSVASQAPTSTPIKHLVVIVGENHTFDNVFATYEAPNGQRIKNLLSEGIVTRAGAPGPRASMATQNQATDTTTYQVTPPATGAYP